MTESDDGARQALPQEPHSSPAEVAPDSDDTPPHAWSAARPGDSEQPPTRPAESTAVIPLPPVDRPGPPFVPPLRQPPRGPSRFVPPPPRGGGVGYADRGRFAAGPARHSAGPPGSARAAGPPPPPRGWDDYTASIRTTDLVPARPIPPRRGWRALLFKATFGLVNPGRSAEELRQVELEAAVRTPLRGNYKIGVLGKGGVGKTTVAASIGSIYAASRQDDRVVAIDADTAFGKLGSRVDPHTSGSYWDLAADEHLDSFADMRGRVGNNAAGLFVLAGESSAARRRVLDPAIYREAVARLDRHFTISIVDCGSTIDAPVTQEALRDLDALIVVSSPWVDGASAAGQTLEYLHNRGMRNLLAHTVIVLNDSDGHADRRTRNVLAGQFAGHGQPVFQVPFDAHLRPGGVIDVANGMSAKTRRAFLEIAATVAQHFSTPPPDRDPRARGGGSPSR